MGMAGFLSLGKGNDFSIFSLRFPELRSIGILSTRIAIEFNGYQSSGNRVEALYKGEN
jgi:hypothetical protein